MYIFPDDPDKQEYPDEYGDGTWEKISTRGVKILVTSMRVGDVYPCGSYRWATVTANDVDQMVLERQYVEKPAAKASSYSYPSDEKIHGVIRKKVNVGSVFSFDAPRKIIPDFPHTCPLCSSQAYVGLFEVIHKSPTKCNARTK